MKKTSIAIIGLMALAMRADAPAGFDMWTGAQLKAFSKSLAPKVNAQKLAIQTLAKYGTHAVMIAHREASGEAELHETQADLFIVQTGAATLKIGGTMVDAKSTGPGEMRGPSISGGEEKKLAPGDVVHIPAKVPHQVMLAKGQEFTYALVKIDEK